MIETTIVFFGMLGVVLCIFFVVLSQSVCISAYNDNDGDNFSLCEGK